MSSPEDRRGKPIFLSVQESEAAGILVETTTPLEHLPSAVQAVARKLRGTKMDGQASKRPSPPPPPAE